MTIRYGPLPSVGKGVRVAVVDGIGEDVAVNVGVDAVVLLGEAIGATVICPQAVSARPMNRTIRLIVKTLNMWFSL